MWKLTFWGFWKCSSFWMWKFLKGSHWPPKFIQFSIFFNSKMRCQKKRHGHNFWISESALNLCGKVGFPIADSMRPWNPKNVAVSFFDTVYFWWRTQNLKVCWLWAAITSVKKLPRPKTTTFSESSGRELSHAPIREKFSLTKMMRRREFNQKRHFSCLHRKNFKWLPIGQYWCQ